MDGKTPVEPPQQQYKPGVDHTVGYNTGYYAYVMTVDRSMEAEADLFTSIYIGRTFIHIYISLFTRKFSRALE